MKLQAEHATAIVIDTEYVKALDPSLDYLKDVDADAKIRLTVLVESHIHSVTSEYVLNYGTMNVSIEVTEGVSGFKKVPPQPYKVIEKTSNKVLGEVEVKQDGVFDIIVTPTGNVTMYPLTAPADVHVLWSIPQYLVMTIGEVLFSVSSMDFAYTEAPYAMKSVMQAANLFTITVGLWIFAILTAITSSTQMFLHRASREAFTYSALMLMDTMLFFVLVRSYFRKMEKDKQLHIPSASNQQSVSTLQNKPKEAVTGASNPAYEEERF